MSKRHFRSYKFLAFSSPLPNIPLFEQDGILIGIPSDLVHMLGSVVNLNWLDFSSYCSVYTKPKSFLMGSKLVFFDFDFSSSKRHLFF